MTSARIRLGIGTGDLGIEQWRFLAERIAPIDVETEVLGRPNTMDHSEVLLDRLVRGSHDGVVMPTRHLPLTLPEGVALFAVAPRRTPLSAVVADDAILLDEFGAGAVIGVDGPLQAAQILFYRPDLRVVTVSGAVRDRLEVLENEEIDALIMPASYAEWLGIQDRVSEILPSDLMMPVAGQGTLSLVGREGDDNLKALAHKLDDRLARREVEAERLCVRMLKEGRPTLAAALMTQQGETLHLEATVVDFGGRRRFHHAIDGPRDESLMLARSLAEELLAQRKAALVEQ